MLCVPCPLCSLRCSAAPCWCVCVVLFIRSVLFLLPGAVVRRCAMCCFLWSAVVRCCAALLGAWCAALLYTVLCSPASHRAVFRPPAWPSPCGAWLAALVCGASCCVALCALLSCPVPLGAGLPFGVVLCCPAVLFAWLPVCVCFLHIFSKEKPLQNPLMCISAFEKEKELHTTPRTHAGRHQDHVRIAGSRVTPPPQWWRCRPWWRLSKGLTAPCPRALA